MKRVVGVVQVHMGSKRLPGKALAEIEGSSMTWHIVNRLRHAESLDEVVIALPDEEKDEPIRLMAREASIPYCAGSESDLIDRLYRTASTFDADAIVRITGDCPLVDPRVVDHLVSVYQEGRSVLDYVSNVRPPTYPHGVGAEVYPTSTLERLWREIREPFYREWFPVYFWEREGDYLTCNIKHSQDLSHLRWTVDYKEDLEFVREVYGHLWREGVVFGMADVLELLFSRPEIGNINTRYPCDNGFQRALDEREGLSESPKAPKERTETPRSAA